MKLRNKITFLFTAVVSAILLLLCIAVYYFSSLSRVSDFRKRLKVRAVTTVKLLVNNDDGINKEQLRRLDEKTFTSLPQKNIIVIKDNGTVEYNYVDDNTSAIKITNELLSKVFSGDDYYFSVDNKDAIIIKESNYYSIAASYDADGYGRLHTLAVILEICFVSGIALTFLSGYFFSFRIVYPIKKISAEVHDISSQNLSRRIPVSNTKDELNELSVTFNDLLTRLQESFEIQKRFIANASHELSTPLTSISSQVQITLQNERSANEYKEVLQSVYEDVRNLTELTRGLLALAKASGTSGGIELSSVRIDELLMRLPAELKTIDPQYSVDLHFDNFPEDENLFHVFGNSDLLYDVPSL
jgi:two-component system, OmpR family, sensor histidine kinase ArlS